MSVWHEVYYGHSLENLIMSFVGNCVFFFFPRKLHLYVHFLLRVLRAQLIVAAFPQNKYIFIVFFGSPGISSC